MTRTFDLQKIEERFLGQSIEEFLANDGDPREYAHLVFAGEVFGPGVNPRDPSLGIETEADLVEALEALARTVVLQVRTLDPHTKGRILEDGEEIDEVHFDFWAEDPAEWERLADAELEANGWRRVSEWVFDDGAHTANIVRA
mgnify:FL=1